MNEQIGNISFSREKERGREREWCVYGGVGVVGLVMRTVRQVGCAVLLYCTSTAVRPPEAHPVRSERTASRLTSMSLITTHSTGDARRLPTLAPTEKAAPLTTSNTFLPLLTLTSLVLTLF